MRYNSLTYIIKEEQKMIEVTTEENQEGAHTPLEEDEEEYSYKEAMLDCLVSSLYSFRSPLVDEQEERIRYRGDEWLKLHEQICDLYRTYGGRVREDIFRSDFKIVFEQAIVDVNRDIDELDEE